MRDTEIYLNLNLKAAEGMMANASLSQSLILCIIFMFRVSVDFICVLYAIHISFSHFY